MLTVNLNYKSKEKNLEICANMTTNMKVAKLRAEPKTISTAKLRIHYDMTSVAFEWQTQCFIRTASIMPGISIVTTFVKCKCFQILGVGVMVSIKGSVKVSIRLALC